MNKHRSGRLIKCFVCLLITGRIYAQAGIGPQPQSDPFSPDPNAYYYNALGSLRQAGNAVQTNADIQFYMGCLNNITNVYRIEGNYSGALDLLIGDIESDGSSPAYQFAYRPQFSKNMQDVINILNQKKVNTDQLQAYLYSDLSAIYTQIGNLRTGLNYQVKCTHILQRVVANKEEYLKASVLLAKEYLLNRNEDSAVLIRDHIETSINSDKDSGLHISYLDLKASILQYQQNFSPAIQLYEQVFGQLKQFHQKHRYYYEMALKLGRLYMQTKQYGKADSVFRRNFNVLYQLQYKSVIFQQTAESLCENMMYMKRYNEASGQLIKIAQWMIYEVSTNSIGMSEADEFSYMPNLENIFNLFYTIMYNDKTTASSIIGNVLFMELQSKTGVYLNQRELLQQTRAYWNTDIPLPYRGLRCVKQLLSDEYALPANKRNIDVDSLKEAGIGLERKISERGPNTFDEIKIKAGDIMTQPGILNVEFVRFNYLSNSSTDSVVYAAIIFEQSYNTATFIPLCSEEDILSLMNDRNGKLINENQLADELYDSSGRSAIKLYNLIWKPLEPYAKKANEINYSPAGILHNVSFNAIYNGKDHLLNIYKLHYFLSLTEAGINYQQYNAPAKINIWGNMDYDKSQFNSKPPKPDCPFVVPQKNNNTSIENTNVAVTLFPNLLTNETDTLEKIFKHYKIDHPACEYEYATEDSFKRATFELKGVLQISTHGFYTPFNDKQANAAAPQKFIAAIPESQFRCGLVFSGVNYYWKSGVPKKDRDDGILTANEIETLRLDSVQLVALIACETGLGDITHTEGNLGLHRAFKLAGAHYILASLWEVPAKQTSELFSLFYENWLSGQPLDIALRNAQITMQKDKGSSPLQWGDFILIE